MNGELLSALERIEREKGIDKSVLFEAIESALASAAKKVIDDPNISKEEITVRIDGETGEIKVFNDDEEIKSERFGRIAAQTAKQVIIQKIREAERDVIFEKYQKKLGSIISGAVHRFEKGNVIVELDDAEAILPKEAQIPRERFRQGEVIRAFLYKVERVASGPEVVLSRTDEGFVRKLFELEVPEISQGIVEIKSIAREAGERTKIAVNSKDERVDPVGACVGMRGSRVRDIVKELHGERIDIVRWDEDIREYLPAAVNPAEISKMVINRDDQTITLTVPKDQLSLLIGKKGRNIRLASKLLGWELIAEGSRDGEDVQIVEVPGLTEKICQALEENGFSSAIKVLDATTEELSEIKGVGGKTIEKIQKACQEALATFAAAKKEAEVVPESEEPAETLQDKQEETPGDNEGIESSPDGEEEIEDQEDIAGEVEEEDGERDAAEEDGEEEAEEEEDGEEEDKQSSE